MTLMTLLAFMNLFPEFRAASWDGWRAILGRLTDEVREFYAICGRGAGKSRIVALLACFFASREYVRAPGERVYVGIFGPDRKQAAITFRYILGLLRSVPALAGLIVNETRDSVELSNGVVIEVITASIAAPRGRAYALVIVEEAAFLPTDQSANPDVEILRATRPALARVAGSLLAVVSSPYAPRGAIWSAYQRYHGQPDGDVVLVQASTVELNPTFDRRAIATAYEEDAPSAQSDYGAAFRRDIETFVSHEAVAACVVAGRRELLPVSGVAYWAFTDLAGGSGGDSFTLGIASLRARAGGMVAAVDLVRERTPPFSPSAVVQEFAEVLRAYGVAGVCGDRYAGSWPSEQFAKHGIEYEECPEPKSDIYRDLLPLLNSGAVELLDHPKLIAQLTGLERRTARGGRDSIDHGPHGHDDVINSASGALLMAADAGAYAEPARLW